MPDANFNDMCLALQPLAQEFLDQVNAAVSPATCKIIVTWRDANDQGAAYDQGLSNAKAGQSPHNCCLADGTPASKAFDFALFESDDSYVKKGGDPRYAEAGAIGKSLGLVWGGNWEHPDYDHLELANWNQAA